MYGDRLTDHIPAETLFSEIRYLFAMSDLSVHDRITLIQELEIHDFDWQQASGVQTQSLREVGSVLDAPQALVMKAAEASKDSAAVSAGSVFHFDETVTHQMKVCSIAPVYSIKF